MPWQSDKIAGAYFPTLSSPHSVPFLRALYLKLIDTSQFILCIARIHFLNWPPTAPVCFLTGSDRGDPDAFRKKELTMKNDPRRIPAIPPERTTSGRRIAVCLATLSTLTSALITVALFTPQAHAADRDHESVTRTRRISYRDLDLNRDMDVAVLNRRLHRAARDICQPTPAMHLNGYSFSVDCVVKALTDGRRQIDRAVASAHDNTRMATSSRDVAPAR